MGVVLQSQKCRLKLGDEEAGKNLQLKQMSRGMGLAR